MKSKYKVGCTGFKYPEKRCIITNKDKYDYLDLTLNNLYKYLLRIPIVKGLAMPFVYKPIINDRVDIYHSFNDVCITDKKWVVTFESMVPRFLNLVNNHTDGDVVTYNHNPIVYRFLEKIAMDNCIRVIALSKCTLSIHEAMLSAYPTLKEKILSKSIVIYPPQKRMIETQDIPKKGSRYIEFVFVGSDFYRKGGGEVVIAFNRLLEDLNENQRVRVKLIIIGDLDNKHNYAHHNYQDNDNFFREVEGIINENKAITHYKRMNNKDILSLIKNSHVGLLPTWADTFGYSVLEFQASGCPVITTNVRALNEINNNEIGWVIDINKNNLGEVVVTSEKDKDACRSTMVDGIFNAMLDAVNNQKTITEKGEKALKRIMEMHCPDQYNKKISEIYDL